MQTAVGRECVSELGEEGMGFTQQGGGVLCPEQCQGDGSGHTYTAPK